MSSHGLLASFGPLKNRNFSLYFAGLGISLIGTFMQAVAQQVFIWDLAHDTRITGLASALVFLPSVVLGPLASSVADRVDRRKLLVVTQIVDMLLAFALAALALSGFQEVWPVLVLAALLGVTSAFTVPAQSAFIGDLSGMAEVRSAYTIFGMVIETARLVGPAIAGYLILWTGTPSAFALNGLSFLAVIASLIVVRAQQAKPKVVGNPLQAFTEALRFMRQQPRILDLILCRVMVMVFIFSSLQLSAAIADLVLHAGPELVGNMFAASGGGALVGALLISPAIQRVSRAGVMMCVSLAWAGVWLFVTSWFTTAAGIIIGVFLYSVVIPVVLTNVSSLSLLLSPASMRARVGGATQMIASASQPVGALVIGYMGNLLGPLQAMRVNGVLMLAFALALLFFNTGFRDWVPAAAEND